MPGYSATPLPKKLGIKEGMRLRLLGAPGDFDEVLKAGGLVPDVKLIRGRRGAPAHLNMLFAAKIADLDVLPKLRESMPQSGALWVCWPKKSSGVVSDVTEMGVMSAGKAAGLVDIKVCAVTDIWSGLKFVIRVKDRR